MRAIAIAPFAVRRAKERFMATVESHPQEAYPMSKSPGHQQHPGHKVEEASVEGRITVTVGAQTIAESDAVIAVHEDGCPTRYYFPRSDVRSALLQPSDTTTGCPFKGTARYYDLAVGDEVLKDAVWSYEDPYDEHQGLKDRLAFYDDKMPEIHIAPKA
jgi:uncharacterized protein (DUF427 family)